MKGSSIMLVEDELITAADIQEALEETGYRVVGVVDNGRDAITQAGKLEPDLILMDIRLKGDIDGVDTAIQIRRRFDIPVVYLTAHADDQTLERAKQAEPLGYIVKPFRDQELHATIEMALHKRGRDAESKSREGEFESTLSALAEGVIRVDGMARISLLNPAAEHWTGWGAEQASGRTLDEVFHLVDQDTDKSLEWVDMLAEILNGRTGRLCADISCRGTERSYRRQPRPHPDRQRLAGRRRTDA